MRYPIWLLPIIIMTIVIAIMSGKQKPWNKCSPGERKKRIILISVGIILFFIITRIL